MIVPLERPAKIYSSMKSTERGVAGTWYSITCCRSFLASRMCSLMVLSAPPVITNSFELSEGSDTILIHETIFVCVCLNYLLGAPLLYEYTVQSLAARKAKPVLLKATEGNPSFCPGFMAGSLAFCFVSLGADQK